MSKIFVFIFSIFILTSLSSSAAVYKGQRIFVKNCVVCHKNGQQFIASKTALEWKTIMDKKGEKLAQIHIKSNDEKVQEFKEYFKSKKYYKKSKHLKQFLMEYAKDSGKVPACN